MSKSAYSLLLCVGVILCVGLLMVFDTTSAEVLDRSLELSPHHALIKQLVFVCLSLFSAVLVWRFGYQKLVFWSPIPFALIVLMLFLVLIPGIGQQINGSRRWLGLASLSIQPSELMKVALPLLFIKYRPTDLPSFFRILAVMFVPLFLILIEPDNGTVLILLLTMCAMFFLSQVKWRYWALPLLVLTLLGGGVASQMGHVRDRIHVYLHPEDDLLGKGHQPYQAKIAAGSGKVWGRGIGKSLQKLNYLPEARSDYIAAIYAEEFGFIGILFLVLAYMILAYLGFHIAHLSPDKEGMYVAGILTFLICVQGFLNLGVVSGLLPSKGTNLPFFSQGGSSLLSNVIALSLILSVGRRCQES